MSLVVCSKGAGDLEVEIVLPNSWTSLDNGTGSLDIEAAVDGVRSSSYWEAHAAAVTMATGTTAADAAAAAVVVVVVEEEEEEGGGGQNSSKLESRE